MTVEPLDGERAAALRAAPLTYRRDALAGDRPPPRYRHVEHSLHLRRRDLDAAARELLDWQVHERAGLRVRASGTASVVGTVVELRLGVGPLAVRIPCRVVEVVDEPDRRGFAYGTLPGHPESGEEWFLLERGADGRLRFTVAAVSREASWLARLGGPVSRAVQDLMVRRYLAALDRP